MENNLKDLLNQPLPKNASAHATMLLVIGGYLVYLAYQMVRDTMSGASSMSMTTTVILAGIMALCGLGVMGYGFLCWRAGVKEKQKDGQQEDV